LTDIRKTTGIPEIILAKKGGVKLVSLDCFCKVEKDIQRCFFQKKEKKVIFSHSHVFYDHLMWLPAIIKQPETGQD
jgi:ribonuclease BN (tRNA processing enzyme)